MLYLPKLPQMAPMDVWNGTYGAKGGMSSPGVDYTYKCTWCDASFVAEVGCELIVGR